MTTTTQAVRTALDRLFRLCCLLLTVAAAQATTVTGLITDAFGAPVSGDLVVSWTTFVAPTGQLVARGTKTVRLSSGAFAIELFPNVGATPSGTFYTVRISAGQINAVETWVVPDSGTPVDVATVRVTIPPTPTALINLSQIPPLPAGVITSGVFDPERLGTGTADATKVLNGEGAWVTPFGGDWSEITGKPSEFPPEAHAASHEDGGADELAIAWAQLTGVPSTFAPSAHAASHGAGQADAVTVTEAQISDLAHFDGAYGSLSGVPATFAPAAHATAHQDGGGDALDLAGLPVAWGDLTSVPSTFTPTAHAASHGAGQADAVTVTEAQISDLAHFDGAYGSLSGVPATFAPTAHATAHQSGGADAMSLAGLSVAYADVTGAPASLPPDAHATAHQDGGGDALDLAGLAVAWGDLTSVPSTFTPTAHAASHGAGQADAVTVTEAQISDLAHFDGAYGSLSGVPAMFAPTAHATAHQSGGADAMSLAGLAVAWGDLTSVPSTFTPTAHAASHGAGQADAVTVTEAQISDLAHTSRRSAATDCTAETGGVQEEICEELDDNVFYVCETSTCEGAGWVQYGGTAGTPSYGFTWAYPLGNTQPSSRFVFLASTATSLTCITPASGVTADIQISEVPPTGGSPVAMLSAVLSCDSDGANTTTFGGAGGASMAEGAFVQLVVSNKAGTYDDGDELVVALEAPID